LPFSRSIYIDRDCLRNSSGLENIKAGTRFLVCANPGVYEPAWGEQCARLAAGERALDSAAERWYKSKDHDKWPSSNAKKENRP